MPKCIELPKNIDGACPCKSCRRKAKADFYPDVIKVTGLYYARCTNPECQKYDPYEFLGTTKKSAIESWNEIMSHHDAD